MWIPFDNGNTIGIIGSENGVIVDDEEYENQIRITIEKNGNIAPWSFTCGIYGAMCHTAFYSNEIEVKQAVETAKLDLIGIINESDRNIFNKKISDFTEKY